MRCFARLFLALGLGIGAVTLASTPTAKADVRHWGNSGNPWWGNHLYSPYVPYGYSTYGYGSPYGYSGYGLGYGGYGGVYPAPYHYSYYSTYPSNSYYASPYYGYSGPWFNGRWW